jgi:hypothetical protein
MNVRSKGRDTAAPRRKAADQCNVRRNLGRTSGFGESYGVNDWKIGDLKQRRADT